MVEIRGVRSLRHQIAAIGKKIYQEKQKKDCCDHTLIENLLREQNELSEKVEKLIKNFYSST